MVVINGDNLWTVQADGSHAVQLTHETKGNFANNPAFSPDGTLIAYAYHIAPQGNSWGGAEVHVMKADGTDERTLVAAKAKGERAESPTWAPDGKSIYFAHDIPIIDKSNRYTGDTITIERVDLATGTRQTIVKNAIFPALSRSGLFVWVDYNVNDGSFKLEVGKPDGSGGRTLLTQKDFQGVYSPEVSPDGKT
ncbi:MAG: TolB family protein, partial [Chloroflexota bacterium]